MATWGEFDASAPEMAAAGRRLLYQGDVAYGFLATVRKDGGPRVHPVCPLLALGRLWVFVVDLSPKYRDLVRDPRYALHAFPLPAGGEEFYLDGVARPEPEKRPIVEATGGMQGSHDFERLFELQVERVLHTKWSDWGGAAPWPEFQKWSDKPQASRLT
jgi:hypothetical protein